MPKQNFMPCFGIDNVSEDAAMVQGGREPFVYVRDAVNVNITKAGKIDMIASGEKVSSYKFRFLWQSPLHKDTFGLLNDFWVKVNISTWESEQLAYIGDGPLWHSVLNNQVCVAGSEGIFIYNGSQAMPLGIPTPPMPVAYGGIDDTKQTRSIAISWLRDDVESGLSSYVTAGVETEVVLPMVIDPTVTGVNIYATNLGGTDMQLAGTVSRDATSFKITKDHELGMAAQFAHLSPMPTGKYLCYWRGRLITATANVIRFSEPLAYHLHDERHGFIQTGQRITFIQPVDGGLWVGQTDHVIFIEGATLDNMSISIKSAQAPIPNSAIQTNSNDIGEAAEGGTTIIVWLASNGYVAGTSMGQVVEYQAGRINGLIAQSSTTVRLARRLITTVS